MQITNFFFKRLCVRTKDDQTAYMHVYALLKREVYSKMTLKSPGSATITIHSQPMTPRGTGKNDGKKTNTCTRRICTPALRSKKTNTCTRRICTPALRSSSEVITIRNMRKEQHETGRIKRIWYLSLMRAAKVQASLRIRAVSPEPPLLAHISSESRGTFRQKDRSLASLNGWACAIKICRDGMLEDTNSLDAPQMFRSKNYIE